MSDERIDGLEPLSPEFFMDDAEIVARKLIGTFLILDYGIGPPAGGRIVETEAYDEQDAASYCFRGEGYEPLDRSEPMRCPGGYAYVYADSCLNFVCREQGYGSAVLIRALQPIWGISAMQIRNVPYDERAAAEHERLCSGPMWLGGALGVTSKLNRRCLFERPFKLYQRNSVPKLVCSPRIRVREFMNKNRPGLSPEIIDQAAQKPWRYADRGSMKFVSEQASYPWSPVL
ncbi:DNA-3-methyladenine glycosylase [Bradyrhizobium sp. ARR65]|uniref:DNA-3-methyladenine glycosylase n=1 Tax=Bradyrhizobium sp. ARR65 TaxID=1040989 RepID=UPI000555DD33|nr:DNA-3-methyladenine glycosylase [Bradyrhizobium sp. ARR65]